MKVLGSAETLAAATTKLNTAAAAHVTNTDTNAVELTIVDSGDSTVGTVFVGAKASVRVSLGNGQGLRGAITFKATPIASSGY